MLLTEDLSGGKEAVAIPVINDVDDEAAPDFHYITDYIGQDDPDVARVLKAMKKEGAAFHRGDVPCGIDFLKGAWDPRFAQDGWDPEQVRFSLVPLQRRIRFRVHRWDSLGSSLFISSQISSELDHICT